MVNKDTAYVTYFSAGLRVFDMHDVERPREVAYYVPDAPEDQETTQLNDLAVRAD